MIPKTRQSGSALIIGLIFILLLLVAYTWGKYYWSSRQDPLVVRCRENLLAIATALEIHQAMTGSFKVDSPADVADLVEEPFDSRCPVSGQPYTYYTSADSYYVACPAGHGEVSAGVVGWRR